MSLRIGLFLIFVGASLEGYSQLDTIYNTNSSSFKTTERIAYYEQLYRFRVTRRIDLKEKQNTGFASSRSNMAGLIIDLVKQGKIGLWNAAEGDPADFEAPISDTAVMRLKPNFAFSDTRGRWKATENYQAREKVIVSITDTKGVSEDVVFEAIVDNTGQDPVTNGNAWSKLDAFYTTVNQENVVAIDLIEDVIFDKRRSRLTYDPLALGLRVFNATDGSTATSIYIKYSDLAAQVEKLYRSKKISERRSVIWQNRYNPSENKKFTDAFKLRLFKGVITKVENPDDLNIMDIIYDKNTGKGSYAEGVFAMWEKEMEMMEKEHNLWEF